MKANELRIGNYVLCEDKIHIVRSRDIYHVENTGLKLQPIPLTEEILFKCGFKKYHNSYSLLSKYEIEYRFTSKELRIWTNDGCTEGHNILITCESVHQLQNLVFALTGTELKIEL